MRRYRSLIIYLVAVAFLSGVYFVSPVSREAVWQLFPATEAMAQANPFVTALMFLFASATLAFLAFPSMPMVYMMAGFYIGGFGGGAIVLLGSAFGGLNAFLFYRKHFRRPMVHSNQQSGVSVWLALIGLRLSPIVPAPVVNFFSVVFRVSPLQYLTTTLIGSAPLVLLYSQIGQQGHQLLSGGPLYWRRFAVYLVILTLSTFLSSMGPWRSVLNEFKQLKRSYGDVPVTASS